MNTSSPAIVERVMISLRIDAARKARLDSLPKVGPYRLTITQVVERGIDLALAELDAKAEGTDQ